MLTALSGNNSEAAGQDNFAGFIDDLEELLRFTSGGADSRLFLIIGPDLGKVLAAQALSAGINRM